MPSDAKKKSVFFSHKNMFFSHRNMFFSKKSQMFFRIASLLMPYLSGLRVKVRAEVGAVGAPAFDLSGCQGKLDAALLHLLSEPRAEQRAVGEHPPFTAV